jgi:hypothetical protein
MLKLTLLSFLSFFFLTGCANKKKQNPIVGNTIRAEKEKLIRNFFKNGGIVVYNSNSDSIKKYVSENFRFFGRGLGDRIKYVSSTRITENQLKNENLIYIGEANSDSVLNSIASDIPSLKLEKYGFYFNRAKYTNSKDVMRVFYHNPYNNGKLCYIITGNNEKEILKNISFNMIGDVRVTRGYETLALGFFQLNADKDWVLNRELSKNYGSEEKEIKLSGHFSYVIHDNKVTSDMVKKIDKTNAHGYKKIQDFVGARLKPNIVNIHLYSSFEEKGLITNNTDLSNYADRDSSVHIVVNDWINGDDFSKIAFFLLKTNLGSSSYNFLNDGLSIYFSNKWGNEGYKFWAAKLYLSNNIPPLDSMLDNSKLNYISRFVYEPLAGSFVDFLIQKYGKEKFLHFYNCWRANRNEVKRLSAEWKEYLRIVLQHLSLRIKEYSASFPAVPDSFLKGICFAHVGYQIYNGYLSNDAFESLEKAKALGVNSFSITPFTSMREKDKPEPFRFWEFSGSENDESLIYLKHVSEILGMCVMMKPHVYLGANSWPGDIEMKNVNDWSLFFHYYYNWILHYAMLSEIYKIPLLCVGNELAKTTVGHGNDWIKLIDSIRAVYDGKLVYAANWGGEFEGIKFWDKLDYIGLSEYYPLSLKENPTSAELFEGAEKVMNKIHGVASKYDKKVIFTEIGFRTSAEPWKTSKESQSDRRKINLENQKRCYEAVLKAAYHQKWLKGLYWWKWPSYLKYNGISSFGSYDLYSPNNIPAQDAIAEWYLKNWN